MKPDFEPPKRSNYLLGFEVQGKQLVHNSNYPRPATNEEKTLWAEYQRAREDHVEACSMAWKLYEAGTGKDSSTFRGIAGVGPIEEVRQARNNLIHVIERTKRQIEENWDPNDQLDATELLHLLDVNNVESQA